jgi:hypothetical protein
LDLVPAGALLWVCANSVLQARSVAQPALKHKVEMEPPSFTIVVASNYLPGYQDFLIEEAG